MTTMKAALYTGIRQLGVCDVERKPPPPGFVEIATSQVGICGSDLHNYVGEWPPNHRFAQGHETCGVITALGDGVTGWKPGDRVAVE